MNQLAYYSLCIVVKNIKCEKYVMSHDKYRVKSKSLPSSSYMTPLPSDNGVSGLGRLSQGQLTVGDAEVAITLIQGSFEWELISQKNN